MSAINTTIIEVRTSPHLHADRSVDMIMRNVIYAMLPICVFAVWLFGISALCLLLTTTFCCVGLEHLACRLSKRQTTVNDYSAAITGILLGLVLPPGFPLWMAAVGSFIAIAPGKLIFGGLGFNVFNPALVGRAFLQAAFPVAIMGYTPAGLQQRFWEFIPSTLAFPLMKAPKLIDAYSAATPLTAQKFDHVFSAPLPLLFGLRAGSTGETCTLLIFLCGLYLIFREIMDWRIPGAMLSGTFVFAALFHWLNPALYPSPMLALMSGGLMLGAMFMATDPVASPVTPLGMWIYGALMGLITVLIRFEGGLAEGVMYAILLGNAVSPLLDRVTQPRRYGERKLGGREKAVA